jgi:hypothetical protein
LSRQNDGDQQLERVPVLERAFKARVKLCETLRNLTGTLNLLTGRFAFCGSAPRVFDRR